MKLLTFLPEGLVRYLNYRKRFRDLNLSPNFALYRKYRQALEVSKIELLPRNQVTSLRLVVDVGANLGTYCTAIAYLTNADQIIAYEPIPEIYQQLKENTRNIHKIHCVESAIGAHVGKITLNIEKKHQLSSVMKISDEIKKDYKITEEDTDCITVPITTLDKDLTEYDEISLLKVDVQGFEPAVFSGAREILKRTKILMTEVTYTPHYYGDSQFMSYLDLIISISDLRLWGVSAPSCSIRGRPLFADAIFAHKSLMNS